MTPTISPSEWEALSAYLDNQLSPKERIRLESSLQTRPDLREGLKNLRRTRIIVRSAARPHAPRHFTLTPEMAGLRSKTHAAQGAYPALRLASVLATIFFLIVFMGDLVSTRLQPAALPAAQFAKEQAAPAGPAFDLGAGGGDVEEAVAAEAPVPEAALAVTSEAALQMEAEPEANGKQSILVTPVGELRLTATPWSEAALADPAIVEEGFAEQPPVTEIRSSLSPGWSFLRLLEILLILLAIFSAAAAYWARRSSMP
jgi:hypothetical protein